MNRRPPAKTLSELGPDAETYARTGSVASLALGFGALATAVVIIGIASLASWEQGHRIDRLHQHFRVQRDREQSLRSKVDALETQLTQTQAMVKANSIAASRIGTIAQDAHIAAAAK